MKKEALKENLVLDKSYKFAVRIVKLHQYLNNEKKEYILSKQIMRSGTSIGANVNEAQSAVSKSDFINKFGIALKEIRETQYWLNLLKDSGYISEKLHGSLLTDCIELAKLINRIILTTKTNLKKIK